MNILGTKNTSNVAWHGLAITLLLAITFVLRFIHMGKADIGNDESFSSFYAHSPIRLIISVLSQSDNPPLWEIVLHFWQIVFGNSEMAIRSLSGIFSALTVVPIYLAGLRVGGKAGAICSAALYVLSPLSLFLAHEGRVYSLIGFLSAVSMLQFIRLATANEDKSRICRLVVLTLCNTLLIYGHYIAVWVPIVQGSLWLLWPRVRRTIGNGMLWSVAATALLFAPMLPIVYARFLDSGINGTWIPKAGSIDELSIMLDSFFRRPYITIPVLLICIASFALHIRQRRQKHAAESCAIVETTMLTAMWAVPLIVSFALSHITGFFLNRYFYFVAPPLYVATACYLTMLPNRRIGLILGILIIGLMSVNFRTDSVELRYAPRSTQTKQLVRQAIQMSDSLRMPIVVNPGHLNLRVIYYYDEQHELFAQLGTQAQENFSASPMLARFRTPEEQTPPPYIELLEIGRELSIVVHNEQSTSN